MGQLCRVCVRPGDKFALCCLICGWLPRTAALPYAAASPPASSLQLDFNLCIMRREWETKQKQKQQLNREQGAGRAETKFAHPIHPVHPTHTHPHPRLAVTNRFCAHMLPSPSPAKGNQLQLRLQLRLRPMAQGHFLGLAARVEFRV